ncbi:MAG: FecR domain-containing protein [Xanthobacteraceae bacterium]|nr:FecR domain-containing protein [Xanthobacteraceae bacterium]
MQRLLSSALLLLVSSMPATAETVPQATSDQVQLAQAQPAQPAAPAAAAPDPAAPAADAQAPEEPIGNVATVTGTASVIRNNVTAPLKVKDDIYLNDVVRTAANSSLGITFIDATTFNLKANAQITIDTYVYEDGGQNNAGVFDVARGTAAFVAAAVAKTGDMKITTPTATLGIRGTTGLVEVPENGSTTGQNNIKLYPDADGHVGRIEVNDRAGARLGFLTQGASGFSVRPGIGGGRVSAVPLFIPPQVIQRDQGFVRQVHSTQNFGRQVVQQQRDFRRSNPNFVNPNRPVRQPGQQPNGQRPNGAPGQNRPGQLQQQPGQPNRPGQQQGAPNRQGQQQPGTAPRTGPQQPGTTPRAGQPQQPGTTPRTGLPQRGGQLQQPGSPAQPGQSGLPPRTGQLPPPGAPPQPGLPPRAGQSQPGLPAQTGAPPQGQPGFLNRIAPQVPGLSRVPGVQGAPALRPGAPGALPRRAPVVPPKGKLPKDVR